MIERQVEIETPDGSMTTFEFHPETGGPYPVVLYLMDAPSIRPALKDMASRLASAGYYVLLPFLYYRNTPYREFGVSDEDMHVRREYMMNVNRQGILIDAQAMLEFAGKNDKADASGMIGAVGFCMSGPLVMGLLQHLPEKVAAAASIHGAWLVSDKQDSPHREIDQIKGEIYFGWADDDPTATQEELAIMDKALADQGVNYRIEFMEGALHGFAPPGGERYHRRASEKHWERVHDLLRRNLG
ncbi:MAG: dienelactone hydrolase family protein [Gammaproteobacteria bacterium]|jgi:carboxymethylenebutenolidase|nr:dienelactone hydrolase family protein [Gammaproteobacteria bacterium]MBT5204775.1 dienelactone hydrolase family protein [Gammaproteobacteria bacterium]MBT5603870.1 dienelactone hydrolase family protein [Gammaproteobacteria bacterium]MBT6244282.1 dienelactone hydrolase family protein [Gammaproteobacteria bacterium]